jgi:hypothetical protein
MRSVEQRVCSAGVRRCSDGLFARFSGAAIGDQKGQWKLGGNGTRAYHERGLRPDEPVALASMLLRSASTPLLRLDASGPSDWRALAARSCWSLSEEKCSRDMFALA